MEEDNAKSTDSSSEFVKNVTCAICLTVLIVVIVFYVRKEGFDNVYEPNGTALYQPGLNDERYDDVKEDDSWQQNIQALGLEATVFDSHKTFVDGITTTTRPASNMPVNDYFNGPVNYVGLARARYHDVLVGPTSRIVPSEDSDQLHQRQRILL